jgi:hypothetical protein
MQEHNPYLNEIRYLIKKYCKEKKIKLTDFDEIRTVLTDEEQKPNKSIHSQKDIDIIPITDEVAKRYLDKFNKYFFFHPKLKKHFRIKSTLFNPSLLKFDKVILRLVERNNSFELAYLVNDEANWINCEKDQLEFIPDLSTLEKAFDDVMGEELDKHLRDISYGNKLTNTRKITINYYGNFDELSPADDLFIYLFPAIIDDSTDPNNHQLTFIMFFDEKIDLSNRADIKPSIDNTYYDTFQLCPPNC